MTCVSILEDDRDEAGSSGADFRDARLDDPLRPALLDAAEHWIRKEVSGRGAAGELMALRDVALRLFRVTTSNS